MQTCTLINIKSTYEEYDPEKTEIEKEIDHFIQNNNNKTFA